MRTFSELSRSFGRSSRKQDKRPSVLPEKQENANEEKKASLEPYAPTIAEDDAAEPVPASTNPTEDLLAICDTLVRPPSQDISRPFDNIPSPRLSESRSGKQSKKKRKSLVPVAPPTLQIDASLTPFGDAFKSFVEPKEPSPSVVSAPAAVTTTTTTATATTTAPAATATTVNAAESDETAGQRTTNTQPTAIDSVAATISTKNNAESRFSASPVPSKEKPPSSPLKAFFGGNKLKNRLSSYWSPEQTTEPLPIGRRYSNDEKLASARPTSPSPKELGKKGSNEFSLSRGFGSIKKLTSRSKLAKDGKDTTVTTSTTTPAPAKPAESTEKADEKKTEEKKTEEVPKEAEDASKDEALQPPAPVGSAAADDDSSSKGGYAHGEHLQPIVEEDK
ncbi:hypothetical protein CPB86DRAFT_816680 [Serendipita vermifera]|nr:hypothetical protein CPB86DRAFT_816680 [Serendipita vermifera]